MGSYPQPWCAAPWLGAEPPRTAAQAGASAQRSVSAVNTQVVSAHGDGECSLQQLRRRPQTDSTPRQKGTSSGQQFLSVNLDVGR